jgi:hypothetical protein
MRTQRESYWDYTKDLSQEVYDLELKVRIAGGDPRQLEFKFGE